MKWQPQDIIALVVIIGGLTLIAIGKDGTIGALVSAVVAFYFGHKVTVAAIKNGTKG